MADKARHAHGSRKNLDAAIASQAVDAFDVLFLSGEDENPAIGWLDKNNNPIIIAPTDDLEEMKTELVTEIASKADAEEVNAQLATKVSAEEVDEKIAKKVDEKIAEVSSAFEIVEF